MMTIDIMILLTAWMTSLGLLGAVVVRYAQTDAAQEQKLANEWVLSRCETRLLERRPRA